MKRILLLSILMIALFNIELAGQCTTAGEGQYPSGTIALNTNCIAKVITTLAWTDEYSLVSGADAQTYIFSSSVGTDYITIADDATNTAIAWGTSPLTYTFGAAPGNIRIYRHDNSSCPSTSSTSRTISVRCTTCSAGTYPVCTNPTAPANNATNVSLTPTLTWPTMTNASQYKVYISNALADCNGSPTYTLLTTTSSLSYTIPGGSPLSTSSSYKWYVAPVACDGIETMGCDASNAYCFSTIPPPPSNDDCSGATSLTVNADLACGTTTAGTTVGALQSTETAPSCNATGVDDDVWYSFVATGAQQTVVISAASLSSAMAIYSGSCGSLTQLSGACATTSSGTATLNLGGLTNGTTYYVRVFTTSTGVYGTFTLCVGTPPPPPANDNCSGAIALTVNADLACAVTTSANTAFATSSSETAPSCSATGVDDDIWYSFTATATKHALVLSSASVQMTMAVYSGNCGALTQISGACANTTSGTATLNFTGLTIGANYKVRIFTTASSGNGTVTICVGTPPIIAGDDCTNPIDLAGQTSPYSGTTADANDDFNLSCITNTAKDKLFTINVASSEVLYIGQTVNAFDSRNYVGYGGACPGATQIACYDDNDILKTKWYNSTGSSQLVYFLEDGYSSGSGTFTLAWLKAPQEANDECAGAITLTPSASGACSYTSASTSGGTKSVTPSPACTSTDNDEDIWFTFTTSAAGAYTIRYNNLTSTFGTASTLGTDLYTGACGSLTPVSGVCTNAYGSSGSGSIVVSLAASTTYTLRMWVTGDVANTSTFTYGVGTFGVCIEQPAACPAPSALSAGTITGTSAILNWTENGSATTWDISYGVAPLADPNTGTIISGTSTKPYTLSGLNGETTYDFYVRAICGGTPSAWSSKATFTTLFDCATSTVLTCGNAVTSGNLAVSGGIWNPPATSCGFSTPGKEKVYRFTPTATGTYTLNITGVNGGTGYIDYFYKVGGACTNTGWTCIKDLSTVTTYTIGTLNAGTEYYFLLDAESASSTANHTFKIDCLPPNFSGTGNWSDVSKWSTGALPICTDAVTIASGANCTIDGSAVCGNITINGTININSNSLTAGCGTTGGNSIFSIASTGTLNVSGGTLTINGSFTMASGAKFNQSGGDIFIDPNTGSSGTSVTSSTTIMSLNNSATNNVSWTGGNITFVDPPFGTSGNTISYSSGSGVGLTPSGGHTVILGGSSSTVGGYPFEIATLGTSARLGFFNLTVSGGNGVNRHGSTVNTSANLTVLNSLNITSGSELRAGATLNIAKNCVNNGTLTCTSTIGLQSWNLNTNVAIASANIQAITGSGVWRNLTSSPTANMTSLTVNNSSGTPITISSSMITGTGSGSISGTLTLTSGLLDIGSSTLTLGVSTSTLGTLSPSTPTSSSYIIGNFERWINTSTSVNWFPIGTSTTPRFAQLTFTGAQTTGGKTSAKFNSYDPGTTGMPLASSAENGGIPIQAVSPTGFWTVNRITGAGGTYTLTVDASGFTKVGGGAITDLSNVKLIKRPTGGSWALGQTGTSSTISSLASSTRTGCTTFSDFAIGGLQSALPVELTTFKGEARQKVNMLSWETASEINSDEYIVERAPEAKDHLFNAIGTVDAKGNTTITSKYDFMDEKPLPVSYYRLKIMDTDGSYEYSKIIVLQNSNVGTGHVNVYPVPAHNAVTFAFTCAYNDDVVVSITDLSGRLVKQLTINASKGQNQREVNIEDLPMGMYHAQIVGSDINSNVRIIRN